MMRVCFTDRFLACRALDLVRRNDSPVSAAQCTSATRDDHVAADSGPLDETGPGVPSALRWPQSRPGSPC
jgi:hypothetical protein